MVVGVLVGTEVGLIVGTDDGTAEGGVVGTGVGTGVGHGVMRNRQHESMGVNVRTSMPCSSLTSFAFPFMSSP